jgi:ABC-type multidrug transport system fused ATPase/permease subunit
MPEAPVATGLTQIPVHAKNNLKIKNVSFKHTNGKSIISNIDFEVPSGKTIAIAGGIDSGKSMLADIITKMKSPTDGAVFFNDIDLEQVNSNHWRREYISYCNNAPKFIPGTIRENFKIFAPNVTDEEIIKAFNDIGAGQFVKKFNNFLDFTIKEGTPLSEGVKNILNIVRCILKPAHLYVFNQCFEHVRHEYINKLMAKIKREKKTAVFVTYNGLVCKNCDTIHVLSGGKITGTGTHAQLSKTNKAYRELHAAGVGVMIIDEQGAKEIEALPDEDVVLIPLETGSNATPANSEVAP